MSDVITTDLRRVPDEKLTAEMSCEETGTRQLWCRCLASTNSGNRQGPWRCPNHELQLGLRAWNEHVQATQRHIVSEGLDLGKPACSSASSRFLNIEATHDVSSNDIAFILEEAELPATEHPSESNLAMAASY